MVASVFTLHHRKMACNVIIILQVTVIDEKPNPNISTFRPLPQQVNDNKKYNGMGYMPCNGYVPCQPEFLSAENLADRIDGSMPCHDYKDKGEGPEGCW